MSQNIMREVVIYHEDFNDLFVCTYLCALVSEKYGWIYVGEFE